MLKARRPAPGWWSKRSCDFSFPYLLAPYSRCRRQAPILDPRSPIRSKPSSRTPPGANLGKFLEARSAAATRTSGSAPKTFETPATKPRESSSLEPRSSRSPPRPPAARRPAGRARARVGAGGTTVGRRRDDDDVDDGDGDAGGVDGGGGVSDVSESAAPRPRHGGGRGRTRGGAVGPRPTRDRALGASAPPKGGGVLRAAPNRGPQVNPTPTPLRFLRGRVGFTPLGSSPTN